MGELPFFSVPYCLWKSLMATVGLPPIPNHPLSITTLQSLHVQSTGYSELLWGNIGKLVVTSLVPWATLTSKCVVKPGTISFLCWQWDRLWDDHSRAPKLLPLPLARCKQGEWHGPCPYSISAWRLQPWGDGRHWAVPGSTAEQTQDGWSQETPSLSEQQRVWR